MVQKTEPAKTLTVKEASGLFFFFKECLVWICLSSRILPLKATSLRNPVSGGTQWTYHKQYSATAWFQSAGPLPTLCYPSFSAPYGWVWLSLINTWGNWGKDQRRQSPKITAQDHNFFVCFKARVSRTLGSLQTSSIAKDELELLSLLPLMLQCWDSRHAIPGLIYGDQTKDFLQSQPLYQLNFIPSPIGLILKMESFCFLPQSPRLILPLCHTDAPPSVIREGQ